MDGILVAPPQTGCLLVLAHGAGAGMRHPFLERVAQELGSRGIATFRYQFAYMERGSRRPDPPAAAAERVREAVQEAARRLPGVPLLAGGKSFGGRMTSTAQALSPLAGVRGLVFFGFPLHPPGRPGVERAGHLSRVEVPMLFLQGTRDDFARLELLRPVVQGLAPRATLHLVEDGDHSFKVRGRDAGEMVSALAEAVRSWADALERARAAG
jgi:predicted alpha/beta-hydrolase family hydrolase